MRRVGLCFCSWRYGTEDTREDLDKLPRRFMMGWLTVCIADVGEALINMHVRSHREA
jgi:hypothetical protein